MATNTKSILMALTKVQGIHESLVVGRDGFVIDHVGDMDAESVGAAVSTAIGAAESLGNDLGQGEMSQVMAEFKTGTLIIAPAGTDAILCIVATEDAVLGAIRNAVKKNIRDLERSL